MTIDLSKLEVGTKLLTRDGRRARLLAKDLANERSCVVVITNADGHEDAYPCYPDGAMSMQTNTPRLTDIVALAPETVRVRVLLHGSPGLWRATAYAPNEAGFENGLRNSEADEIVEVTLKGGA